MDKNKQAGDKQGFVNGNQNVNYPACDKNSVQHSDGVQLAIRTRKCTTSRF